MKKIFLTLLLVANSAVFAKSIVHVSYAPELVANGKFEKWTVSVVYDSEKGPTQIVMRSQVPLSKLWVLSKEGVFFNPIREESDSTELWSFESHGPLSGTFCDLYSKVERSPNGIAGREAPKPIVQPAFLNAEADGEVAELKTDGESRGDDTVIHSLIYLRVQERIDDYWDAVCDPENNIPNGACSLREYFPAHLKSESGEITLSSPLPRAGHSLSVVVVTPPKSGEFTDVEVRLTPGTTSEVLMPFPDSVEVTGRNIDGTSDSSWRLKVRGGPYIGFQMNSSPTEASSIRSVVCRQGDVVKACNIRPWKTLLSAEDEAAYLTDIADSLVDRLIAWNEDAAMRHNLTLSAGAKNIPVIVVSPARPREPGKSGGSQLKPRATIADPCLMYESTLNWHGIFAYGLGGGSSACDGAAGVEFEGTPGAGVDFSSAFGSPYDATPQKKVDSGYFGGVIKILIIGWDPINLTGNATTMIGTTWLINVWRKTGTSSPSTGFNLTRVEGVDPAGNNFPSAIGSTSGQPLSVMMPTMLSRPGERRFVERKVGEVLHSLATMSPEQSRRYWLNNCYSATFEFRQDCQNVGIMFPEDVTRNIPDEIKRGIMPREIEDSREKLRASQRR